MIIIIVGKWQSRCGSWFLNRRANARVGSPRQIWISDDDHHIIHHHSIFSFYVFQQGTVNFYDSTKL